VITGNLVCSGEILRSKKQRQKRRHLSGPYQGNGVKYVALRKESAPDKEKEL